MKAWFKQVAARVTRYDAWNGRLIEQGPAGQGKWFPK